MIDQENIHNIFLNYHVIMFSNQNVFIKYLFYYSIQQNV